MDGANDGTGELASWTPDGEDEEFFGDQSMVVPFLGAGFSAAGGLPNANEFRDALVAEFASEVDTEDLGLFGIANMVAGSDMKRSLKLREFAATYFENALAELEPEPKQELLLDNIVQVPSKLIVTLNYDGLIEKAARRHYRPDQIEVISNRETLASGTQRARESPGENLMIVHLHGSAKDPETIVLDKWGYEQLEGRTTMNFFRALMEGRKLCFLGTTFDEAGHVAEFMQTGVSSQQHLLFATSRTISSIKSRNTLDRYTHNIDLRTLPHRDTLHGLVEFLARTQSDPPALGTQDLERLQVGALIDEFYLEGALVPWSEDARHSEWFQRYRRGTRQRWNADDSAPEFEHERTLANENVVLVVGPPGSGKTQFLAKAATLVSGPRRVGLVRLGAVPVLPGDLPTTLERWARSAGMNVSARDLVSESFHFFLDGIDEVAPESQEDVARTIFELAREFPQHNFTASSRPVPAAIVLSDLGWSARQIELGSNWQHRYLEARGLTLAELMDGQEVPGELASLLQLPFFLSQAVELHRLGQTRSLTAWGLLNRLVWQALEKESSLALLPVSVEDARTWLQQCALAMRFSGVTALSQENIRSIPMRDGLPLSDQFIPSMIDRSMLRDLESAGSARSSVSFSHRIIGEFLVAESLLKIAPEPPVLDAIAPIVGPDRSGVAPHWTVPVSLLISQSSEWRQAIKPRDRMLWAASVPADAPVDERREAASTLWMTYRDWRVWIWRRERSGFLQDGEALSRLLATEGLEELISSIRADLDDPSPQIQSNALEVLSGARVAGLEDKLLEMLQDDSRDPVVKRRVAVAAEDLGFHKLVDELVRVATSTGDDAEAETCTSAALALASDEGLVDVAVKLVTDPLASLMVMPGILDRVTPEGAVRVLRAQIEANLDDLPFSSEKDMFRDAIVAGDETDPAFAEDVIFVAAAWGLADDSILWLIEQHRSIALQAIFDATTVDQEAGAWWHAGPLLKSFAADEVEAAGFHSSLVQGLRIAEQQSRHSPAESSRADEVEVRNGLEAEEERELTLSEVLAWDRDRGDGVLQQFPSEFSKQVKQLALEETDDLRERLSEWLKEESFLSAFSFVSRSNTGAEYRVEGWAHAWFWFGPALNLSLDSERWAQMALFGVAYDPQHEWLRNQATPESQEWLAKVRGLGDARDWRNALLSSPLPLSEPVLAAIERDLLVYSEELGYDIEYVLQRLSDEGAERTMRRVAENRLLAPAVNRHLAELGDEEALRKKFAELKEAIAKRTVFERESIPWLKGAQDERYLPALFECLTLHVSNQVETPVHRVRETDLPRRRDRSIRGRMDETPNFLMETIQAIGGESAARGYEALLRAEPEKARWLRFRLDQIEGAMFTAVSERAAVDAVDRLALPKFQPEFGREQS